MKYIKKFENLYLFSDLEIGDYLLINNIPNARLQTEVGYMWVNGPSGLTIRKKIYPYAKIIKKAERIENPHKFKILGFDENLNMIQLWIKPSDIIRKLSPSEIDDFDSRENAIKYNL